MIYAPFISSSQSVCLNCNTHVWKDGVLVPTQTWQQCAAPRRRVLASLFEIKFLPMYFVVGLKLLLLYRVNSYSTHLMCVSNEIFIAKKFSFFVRLYFVCIRNVLKLNFERSIVACSVHHTPVLFNGLTSGNIKKHKVILCMRSAWWLILIYAKFHWSMIHNACLIGSVHELYGQPS